MDTSAQRVAQRFIEARSKALYALVAAIFKAAGGARAIIKTMDPEMMTKWDKEAYYRDGYAEDLLDSVLNRHQKPQLVTKWLQQAWDRKYDQRLDFDDDPKVGWDSGRLTIEWRADGGTWRPAPDEQDSQDELDYYDEHKDEIDYDYNAGQLDMEINDFIRDLGGEIGWLRDDQKDDPSGGYVYNQYRCQAVWKIKAEDLARMSIDKIIDQAGKSVRWEGERT